MGTCAAHTDGIRVVAAMPDGQRILSGSDDCTVRVHLLNGTHVNTFAKLHTGYVLALVALPDNQHALSGSGDKTVKLFNVNDGAVLRTFKHHTDYVFSLALLPDGLRFVSGSYDETARIVYHGLARRWKNSAAHLAAASRSNISGSFCRQNVRRPPDAGGRAGGALAQRRLVELALHVAPRALERTQVRLAAQRAPPARRRFGGRSVQRVPPRARRAARAAAAWKVRSSA